MLLHVCTVSDIHKMMHVFKVCIGQNLLHKTTLYLSIMYACFFNFASDLKHYYIHPLTLDIKLTWIKLKRLTIL